MMSLADILAALEERRAHYQQKKFDAKACINAGEANFFNGLEGCMVDALDCVKDAKRREEKE